MDLLQTLLVYMTVAVSSTIGAAPIPTATPVPTPAPTAIVTPAPVTETPVTAAPATLAPEATKRPEITTNPAYKIIRPKQKGEDVKKLQLRLKELGYLTGEADGVFGNQTKSAVMRFQKAHGLTRDGVAGPATLTILYEDPNVVLGPAVTPTAPPPPEPTAEPTQAPASEPLVELALEPTAAPESLSISEQEPTQVPPLEADAAEEPAAPQEEIPQPLDEAEGTVLAILTDGRVEMNDVLLDATHLVGVSAEMDVLIDLEGLAQAMGWVILPDETGEGYQMEIQDHQVSWAYTLTESDGLDLVTVICDGEPVELTEAMTALVSGRLFLAPLWLENLGAQIQWNQETLTLAITMK